MIAGLAMLAALPAEADVLQRVKEEGVLKLGFREDTVPFAYLDGDGQPTGYSVELCRAVAQEVGAGLDLAELTVEFVPVGAEDRFQALQQGEIDLLCGATTATLSRRELVDFSLPTFIDGASVLYRADGPADFEGLAGKKVGVRGGTTTEEALQEALARLAIEAEVVAVGDHHEGLERLEAGEFSAYFADQSILLFLMLGSPAPDRLRLSSRFFTREPYALALPRGDDDFRLLVDRALSRLYRSGDIKGIFGASFGLARPSKLLEALYQVSALPE